MLAALPLVSVVVPTHNGLKRLPVLLEALRRQTLPQSSFELIIVDDGSTDGTADWLGVRSGARVIRAPGNIGQGAADNLGVRAASAPIVAMTDDDTVPAEDWLEAGLSYFRTGSVSFAGGRITLVVGSRPSATALLDYGMGYLDQEKQIAGGFAATANFWARRDDFLALGGFNEALQAQCHDVEFGYRLRSAGFTIHFASDAAVAHPARHEVREFARKQFRIGASAAELRRYGVPPFSTDRPMWAELSYYRPWLSIWGMARIRALGIPLSPTRVASMWCAQYFALQLPMALGSLLSAVKSSRLMRAIMRDPPEGRADSPSHRTLDRPARERDQLQ